MDVGATIFSAGLLNELKQYSGTQSQSPFWVRVKRIYNECLKTGHLTIAQKIAGRYPHIIFNKSDIVMAFGMAMMASKQKEDGKD